MAKKAKASDFITVARESASNVVKRKDVKFGELFKASGGRNQAMYAHMGDRTDPPTRGVTRYQSINLDTGECASTSKGDKNVEIVGSFKIAAVVHEDYA